VREVVDAYELTAGSGGQHVAGHRYPVVVVTTREAKGGKLRKNPVMRVTDGSAYAVVASKSGSDD
jgi:F420H(2)-dependent quinone reductase